MTAGDDTNASIWKSDATAAKWAASAAERYAARGTHWEILSSLLPFDAEDRFVLLDLGAGTGAASRAVLEHFPRCQVILAEYSPQMIAAGTSELAEFDGRFGYVEFDLLDQSWPDSIPSSVDAVITSLVVHHLPDDRKRSLFAEILARLVPGGWYLNYDPVTSTDPVVEAAWLHTADRLDPEGPAKRAHRSAEELARHENHVRYMIPLEVQLGFFRASGFEAVDVYWKHLENVIYGGRRPLG